MAHRLHPIASDRQLLDLVDFPMVGATAGEESLFQNIEIPEEGIHFNSLVEELESLRGDVKITGTDAAEVSLGGHKLVRAFEERLADVALTVHDRASAERIAAPAPRHAASRAESRSHKLAHASFAPMEDRPVARLPKDPVKMLEALLDRVRAARR